MNNSINHVKVTVDIGTEFKDLHVDSISIMHTLDDIPIATAAIHSKDKAEADWLTRMDKLLFQVASIAVSMNGIVTDTFTGIFAGAQTVSNASNVGYSITIYGGPYRLHQMSTFSADLHVLLPGDLTILQNKMVSIVNGPTFKMTSSVVTNFVNFIISLLKESHEAVNFKPTEMTLQQSAILNAYKKLHTFHYDTFIDVFEKEMAKIIDVGAASEILNAAQRLHQGSRLASLADHANSTIWSLFMYMLSTYRLHVSSYDNKTIVFPDDPLTVSSISLDNEFVSSISVSPFPISVYTRCYFKLIGNVAGSKSKDGKTPQSSVIESAMYPTLQKCGEKTPLEKLTGAVRVLLYDEPLTNINKVATEEKYPHGVYDAIAKGHLIKESFRNRSASIGLAYGKVKVPLGVVITFTDPFFSKVYHGYVVRVHHNVSTTSIGTSLSLQYVLSDAERELLGIDKEYISNVLYPDYDPAVLLEKYSR